VQVVIVLIFLGTILVLTYTLARRYRIQNKSPKYVPGSYLKQKWYAWTPRTKYGQVGDGESGRSRSLSVVTAYNPAGRETGEALTAAERVDRHASVRSVMTLPPYSHAPRETEEVIGREGERDGLDMVVEFPETQDEEERHRDEQMESLYQIRVARRQEIADREARRQARREARAAGDYATLEQLRRESRQRAQGTSIADSANGPASVSAATLLAEHQSRGRDRRISEVTYASVGRVRHDGTRLRANSDDSESGLLDSAAGMGEHGGRSRGNSDAPSLGSALAQSLFRDRSASALSVSTNASDLDNQAPRAVTPLSTTARAARGSADTSNSSTTAPRLTPEASTGTNSDDISDIRMPGETIDIDIDSPLPPDYEHLDWGDAPAYTEAEIRRRESVRLEQQHRLSVRNSHHNTQGLSGIPDTPPQLGLELPDIHIEGATEPNTPVMAGEEFEMQRR
jgi:hypothetical protein